MPTLKYAVILFIFILLWYCVFMLHLFTIMWAVTESERESENSVAGWVVCYTVFVVKVFDILFVVVVVVIVVLNL